jgi:hypothetical protein
VSVRLKIRLSLFLLKSYQKKKIQSGLERIASKGSRDERPGLAAPGVFPVCTCWSTQGLEATLAPVGRTRWMSVKSMRPRPGALSLGSSPTFSLHQLSCQLCAHLLPLWCQETHQLRRQEGGKAEFWTRLGCAHESWEPLPRIIWDASCQKQKLT